MSDEERKLRSARARETVSLPFLLLPRTPSSSLLSLPCADAQGWNSTHLDNARKFRMKFTVADPLSPILPVYGFENPLRKISLPRQCRDCLESVALGAGIVAAAIRKLHIHFSSIPKSLENGSRTSKAPLRATASSSSPSYTSAVRIDIPLRFGKAVTFSAISCSISRPILIRRLTSTM